jgi:uncharacterized RDD family membrane protein YckC
METPMVQYAGFWKRFVAYVIDSIIIGMGSVVLLVPFFAAIGVSVFSMNNGDAYNDSGAAVGFLLAMLAGYLLLTIGILAAGWLYFALMESSGQQGTLGKMAISIKVTDLAGNKISFGRASGRYFAKIISSLTLGIGYVMTGFTQQKQALHDMIAGCLVVNK